VDREFYVMEGDIYLKGDRPKRRPRGRGRPDFVVFNGSAGSLSKERSLKAKGGETVRIFFGNAGPNAV
jgi:nitrite reductase (NO-forming)